MFSGDIRKKILIKNLLYLIVRNYVLHLIALKYFHQFAEVSNLAPGPLVLL